MVKFDEISEDNINDLSPEELREIALSGKSELMSARGVIWDLNKKIKTNDNPNEWDFNEEKFNELLSKKQKEEKFNNFLSESNLDEEQSKRAREQFDGWYNLEDIVKLSGATSFEQNQNNSNRMNIWHWQPWTKQQFEWKLPYSDYKQLDRTWQDAYKSFSRGKFGGLAFDRSSNDEI